MIEILKLQSTRIITLTISLALLFAVGLAPSDPVSASVSDELKTAACAGTNIDGTAVDCTSAAAGDALSVVLKTAIRIFQTIVGVISLFVIIIAGLGYITSGGDSAKTKTAKDRLLYAAIGLVVVALAEVIIQFVLNRANPPLPPSP